MKFHETQHPLHFYILFFSDNESDKPNNKVHKGISLPFTREFMLYELMIEIFEIFLSLCNIF